MKEIIKINEEKIKTLKAEHKSKQSKLIGTKPLKAFLEASSEIDAILYKIEELTKKNKFISEGKGPNGVSELFSDLRIVE
tara:strand:- start:4729 stop:4968 length:240 start_codon:yes stop_codon:yes gene_type:complete